MAEIDSQIRHVTTATNVPPMAPPIGLDQIAPGSKGVVKVVAAENGARRRLLEMGFVPGTALRVVRLAPLGDPMEVELHGYHISLRRSEARAILVEPC